MLKAGIEVSVLLESKDVAIKQSVAHCSGRTEISKGLRFNRSRKHPRRARKQSECRGGGGGGGGMANH